MRVGIVGVGMVGSAVKEWMEKNGHRVVAYDKDPKRSTALKINSVFNCDVAFISVPTLTLDNGRQDLSPLWSVMREFADADYKGVIIHKCTVVPGTTEQIANKYPKLTILHNPEFLRERCAFDDYRDAKIEFISGSLTLEQENLIDDIWDGARVLCRFKKYESSELAKYAHNCFLSTKLSFFNEFYEVCEHFKVSYADIIDALKIVGGIGLTHLDIPGPDGKKGWGGSCFPKDTKAFITAMALHGFWMDTLAGAIKANKKVRGE